MRRIGCVSGVALLLWLLAGSAAAHADDSWYFPQTGHTVSGKFLQYWQTRGGLPVFGYPTTDAQNEVDPETGKTFLTQWFERNRFELHPENAGTRYEILLGLLGKDLRREALVADPDFQPHKVTPFDPAFPADQQRFFDETGHRVRPRFYTYWQANGGLERFGFPIGDEHLEIDPETGKTFSIQWFERARFEYHPENAGTQYEVLLGLLGKQLKQPKPGAEFVWKIGRDPYEINYPQGVAAVLNGSVYVMDAGNYRVQKYTADGRMVTTWGSAGARPGQFGLLAPGAIIADNVGNVYVNDLPNHRIQKFDGRGSVLAVLALPDAPGVLTDDPRAIAVDAAGQNLYVLDSVGRIIRFVFGSPTQSTRTIWKDNLPYVSALAVDPQGNVYAAYKSDNIRINKYAPDGSPIEAWNSNIGGRYEYHDIVGITIDPRGAVHVLDNAEHRVFSYTSIGDPLSAWGIFGTGDDQLATPTAISASLDKVYITDAANGRVQIFDHAGKLVNRWSSDGSELDRFKNPAAIALDNRGVFYVADSGNSSIKKFDTSGTLLLAWGGQGNAPGKLSNPQGVAVDPQGAVYVADSANHRIQKFAPDGTFLGQWGGYGTANGQFDTPTGVAADARGLVYVADSLNRRVQVFDANGRFVRTWGRFGGGANYFAQPTGIAIGAQGQIFVADTGNPSIQKYDSAGNYQGSWIAPRILGIATDPRGSVYSSSFQVQKWDANGGLQFAWSGLGNGNGELSDARGIAVDAQGFVYVADTRNHRVQKFRLR